MNWYKQFIYWAGIVTLSYFTYDKLISVRKNILPDFSSISNELWIIILIFIFQVLNNIRLSNKGTVKRKKNYLKSRYTYFYKLYGKKIKEITQNEILEAICFAIIIYEDFNRPKIIRFIEKLSFYITKKPHSLGVMQVSSNKNINDYESVIAGAKKIVESYNIAIQKNRKEYFEIIDENSETIKNYNYDWKIIDSIIADYNNGTKYSYEVNDLYQIIKKRFYKKTKDRLLQ